MKFKALLLALALVITVSGTAGAAVTEHRESTTNLSIAYPVLTAEDGVVADPINADIAALAARVHAEYESGAFYRGELGYRVHLDDENFLSVTFTDLRYALRANQPTRHDYGFVYYKKTGQRLPLAFFVHVTRPISTVRRSADISTTSRGAIRRFSRRSPSARFRRTTSSAGAASSARSSKRVS